MPKPGKPFSYSPDFDQNLPVALPDLLAGLMSSSSLDEVSPAPVILTPEVMAPEDEMPPATPVNTAMPEFLTSLRSLLTSYDDSAVLLNPDLPSEAVQDFAHGTNELLTYLLHEVVGSAAPVALEHSAEASLDFAEATNELLNYLLSQVSEPEVRDDTVYTPEAMQDFEIGTQDLLRELLAMAEQDELLPLPIAEGVLEPPPPLRAAAPLDSLLGDLLMEAPVEMTQIVPEALASPDDLGLLSGLLANLTGSKHNLGEAPREYIDESDEEAGERPAGPFELLLDAIDGELPPPPAVRGVLASSVPVAADGERFIGFELASESYALPFDCVLETDHVSKWTHVPGIPAHVRGVLNLRGEIIPLVDLRTLFGLGTATAEGRMIVIRDRCGKTTMALVVDRLMGLVSILANEIRAVHEHGVVRGVASASGRDVGLLDPERLIGAAHGDRVLGRHSILQII